MAKMVTDAGDMEVNTVSFSSEGKKFVITGQMGLWDAKIYVEARESLHIIGLLLHWSSIKYLIRLPFICIAEIISKK